MDARLVWFIAAAIGLAVVSVSTSLNRSFQQDMGKAYERLDNYGAVLAGTACGSVEHLITGDGQPALVIHGIMGGVDQGAILAEGHLPSGYQSVVVSRFGYLGSPLPDDAIPADQADAFACLLDSLDVDRAVVLGTSAGATSALHFALRYPDRCSCLILISPNAPGEVDVLPPPKPVASAMYRSNFGFWLLMKYFRSFMVSMIGVPKGFEITPDHDAVIDEVLTSVLPVKPRADGALFDLYISNPSISEFPLEEIGVPVLVIGALDDPLALFKNTSALANRIPNAELVSIKDGGHLMLGHEEEVRAAIQGFLMKHSSSDS